jgi:hypothetical protein
MGVTQRYGPVHEGDDVAPDPNRVSSAPTHYPVMARAHHDAIHTMSADGGGGEDSRFPDNLNPRLQGDL